MSNVHVLFFNILSKFICFNSELNYVQNLDFGFIIFSKFKELRHFVTG